MMSALASLQNMFAGCLLAATILTLVSFRLRAMLRAYAMAAFFLALLAVSLGLRHDTEHLYVFAVATVLLKSLAIPLFLLSLARTSKAPLRLQSHVRPASTFFIAALVCGVAFSMNMRGTALVPSPSHALLMVSVSLVLLGFVMMVLRRDILSQMVGFLTLENGISMISVMTVGSFPLFIEMGVFSAVATSTFLMSHLFRRIQEIYGAPDSSLLNELVE